MKMNIWTAPEREKLTQLAVAAASGADLVRMHAGAGYERTAQALYTQMQDMGLGDKYPSLRTSLYRHISAAKRRAPAAAVVTRAHVTAHVARIRHIVQSVDYGDMTKAEAFNAIRKLVRS